MDVSTIKINKCNIAKDIFFWFVVVDILFLPYLPWISLSISAPFIVGWYLSRVRYLYKSQEGKWISAIIFLMFLSSITSLFYPGETRFETTFLTTIKRFLQYSTVLMLYLYYKTEIRNRGLDNVIYVFSIVIVLYSVVYFLFPLEYAIVKIQISPIDNHTRRYLEGLLDYRFNYLWTDPNNVAYLAAGIETWALLNERITGIKKYFIITNLLFVIFFTASNGGILSVVITNGIIFLCKIITCRRIRLDLSIVLLLCVLLIPSVCVFGYNDDMSSVIMTHVESLQRRFEYYQNKSDYSGGRLADIKATEEYFSPLFFIIGSGKEGFSKEIGHLYWICMYGGLAYYFLMKLLFSKIKMQMNSDYLWILPFFLGFTMNIGIGEYKWLAVYLLLLAQCRYSNLRKK